MNKIEIRFWDIEKNNYFDESSLSYGSRLMVDQKKGVWLVSANCLLGTDLEPHFYKDGERIDGE